MYMAAVNLQTKHNRWIYKVHKNVKTHTHTNERSGVNFTNFYANLKYNCGYNSKADFSLADLYNIFCRLANSLWLKSWPYFMHKITNKWKYMELNES